MIKKPPNFCNDFSGRYGLYKSTTKSKKNVETTGQSFQTLKTEESKRYQTPLKSFKITSLTVKHNDS